MDYRAVAFEIADSDGCYEEMLTACLNYMQENDIREMLRYNEYYLVEPTQYERQDTGAL